MRSEQCEKCPHLTGEVCGRKGAHISKIRGCSQSASGKQFFRAKSGKESFRMRFIGRKGEKV